MSSDKDIDGWLAEQGYSLAEPRARARAALEEAGLTRPGKVRISAQKLERAAQVLAERFFPVCADAACQQVAQASGREPLRVEPKAHCERCGGSSNRRAGTAFLEACKQRGVRKLVVVGGSPSVRMDLETQVGNALALRMVDGTERHTGEQARHNLEWADLVLVWGATELHHKVSTLYTTQAAYRHKVVHIARRGVASLLEGALTHLQR